MTDDEIIENHKTYDPDALPEQITRTLYLGYGVGTYNQGQLTLSDSDNSHSENFGWVLLVKQTVTFNIPKCKVDVRGKLLEILEEEKQKVLADNYQRLKLVQDKIDRLLAIENHTL